MGKKGKSENVQVILRVRPLNKKETERGNTNVVGLHLAENAVTVKGAGCDDRMWAFDGVYNNSFSQKDVYIQSIHPVVETVLSGFNATVFAYGQSGTGKSYSMCGNLCNKEQYGVIPNALAHIYQYIADNQSDMMEYHVFATFTELYNGKCRDLCVDKSDNLELKENAQKLFFVKDLSMWEVKSVEEAMELMEKGITRREVKSTDLNADSSRSHSLFSVYVRTWDKEQDLRTEAKLNLVDLAGSERQKQSGASGDTLKEGNNINLSLTALGGVIDCLVKQKPHIPYRSSPLTMLLKDGLGGNSRTIIVGTIGPSDSASNETVSTLRFIDRAKQIKNKPKVQMDPKDAKISELLEEVKKLRRQLGLDEDADADDEDGGEETEGQLKRKKSNVKLFDDEIEALKRRIEELEVQVEMSSETVANAQSAQMEHAQKEEKLKTDHEAKMAELRSQLSEVEDSRELLKMNNDDSNAESKALFQLCTTFLTSIDQEGIWTKTVHLDPLKKPGKKDPQPPTVDDIGRGFKMFVGNGVDMKLHALTRRASMAHIQGSGTLPSGSSKANNNSTETSVSASPATSASPTTTGKPTPPAGEKPTVSGSTNNRSFSVSMVASPQPDSESDEDDPLGPDPKKKDKKEKKKDKKDKKKDKKDKKEKKANQAVAAGELSTDVIDSVLSQSGITDPSFRIVVDEVLMKQRQHTNTLHQQRIQAAAASGNGTSSPELIATVDELNDALTVAHDTIAKQKLQLLKTKGLAEKKLGDVTQLKEHIDSLRSELAEKHVQHAAELALLQDRLVQNHNKKMEQLVNKHTKGLVKERKAKEVVQKKLDKQIDKYGKLEQDYDVKVMEADSCQRDLEDLKIDNLKRFKDAATANRNFHTVVEGLLGEGGKDSNAAMMANLRNEVMDDTNPQKNRLRQVVERSAGGSRNDKKVPMPHSAPDFGGGSNTTTPAPNKYLGIK